MKKLLILLIIITFSCKAQKIKIEPKLKNTACTPGIWHGTAFGGKTEEIWSNPAAGSMMATFKLTENDKIVFYEIEIIRKVKNSLILQLKHFGNDLKGWKTKDQTIDFPLKEITKNKEGIVETVTFNYKKKN